MVRRGLAAPPKTKRPLYGAFRFWKRVWAFEPCSTNAAAQLPVSEAAPQAQLNPTLSARAPYSQISESFSVCKKYFDLGPNIMLGVGGLDNLPLPVDFFFDVVQ